MNIFFYILEWIGTFLVIWGLNFITRRILGVKLNPITTAVATFIIDGFLVFLIAPFVLTLSRPEYFYLPILIFFLIVDVVRANRQKN